MVGALPPTMAHRLLKWRVEVIKVIKMNKLIRQWWTTLAIRLMYPEIFVRIKK
jgi:hypothetical protein